MNQPTPWACVYVFEGGKRESQVRLRFPVNLKDREEIRISGEEKV
jgi:hypothetical protein